MTSGCKAMQSRQFPSLVSKSRNVPTISDVFVKKYLDFERHDLLKACENIPPKITDEEVRLIEEDTRSQQRALASIVAGLENWGIN